MKVIGPTPHSLKNYLSEIFKFRQLIITFGTRDLKNTYAQSFLGIAWTFLQPLAGIIIFSFVFGHILKIQSGGFPYPVFAYIGMLAWFCFTSVMGASSNSLLANKEMIKKIYFPKILLPFSKVFTGMVEFAIWLFLLAGLMLLYGIVPSWRIVFLPAFFILDILTGLSIGLWLSALTYRKKDLVFIVPYLAGFGVMITPIFYPNSMIPLQYEMMKYCNPLCGIVEGFRWSILGTETLNWNYCIGFIPVVILIITAFLHYRKIEGKLADIL
ncbi:MAG: ABC transporter permease [Bacteroidota bacterium]